MPYYLKDDDILEVFSRCGPVLKVHVGVDSRTGYGRGYAFVSYYSTRDAKRAYKYFKGRPLDGRELRVDWDIGIPGTRRGRIMKADNTGAREQEMGLPQEQTPALPKKPPKSSRSSGSSGSSSQSSRSDD